MTLPQDAILLMSWVNTRLRDQYPTLDALCEDLGEDKAALCRRLGEAGFAYDAARNQFR